MDLKQLLSKIEDAIINLKTLKIRTIVGKTKTENDVLVPDANSYELVTEIDLIDGDIITVIPPDCFSEEKSALLTYHQNREAQGHEIIEKNIQTLLELLELVRKTIQTKEPT